MLFPFVCLSVNFVCVKDFSGTTYPSLVPNFKILGCTKLGYVKLYCVFENQQSLAYCSLYLSIFLSIQEIFLSKISQELFYLKVLKLGTNLGTTSCIVYLRISCLQLILSFIYPILFPFKIFYHISSVCIRVRDFRFHMHVQNDQIYY